MLKKSLFDLTTTYFYDLCCDLTHASTRLSERMLPRVHQPSPSPGASDAHIIVRERDLAAITELGWPAVLDIEGEADLNVVPFAFKILQLTSLVDPKSLEKLDNLGGVEDLLRRKNESLSTIFVLKPLQ